MRMDMLMEKNHLLDGKESLAVPGTMAAFNSKRAVNTESLICARALLKASHSWSHLILTASPWAKHSAYSGLGLVQAPSQLPARPHKVGSVALAPRPDAVGKLKLGTAYFLSSQHSPLDHIRGCGLLLSPEMRELCRQIRHIVNQCDPSVGWNSGFCGATSHCKH